MATPRWPPSDCRKPRAQPGAAAARIARARHSPGARIRQKHETASRFPARLACLGCPLDACVLRRSCKHGNSAPPARPPRVPARDLRGCNAVARAHGSGSDTRCTPGRALLLRAAAGLPEKQLRFSALPRVKGVTHSEARPADLGPSLGAEMPATRSSSSARRRSTRALSPPASPGAASVPAAVLSPQEASSGSHAAAPAPAPREQAHDSEGPTAFVVLTTYFAYAMLVLMGHIRDFLGRMAGSRYRVLNGVKVRGLSEHVAWRPPAPPARNGPVRTLQAGRARPGPCGGDCAALRGARSSGRRFFGALTGRDLGSFRQVPGFPRAPRGHSRRHAHTQDRDSRPRCGRGGAERARAGKSCV